MKNSIPDTITHEGFTIRVNERYNFVVQSDDKDAFAAFGYESLAKAKEAINEHLKVKERASRERVELRALNTKGEQVTLTGIHASTGELLLKGDVASGEFYPDVPGLRGVLIEIDRYRTAMQSATQRIRQFRLDPQRGYGRMNSAEHARKMEHLKADYARALKAARAAFSDKVSA